LSQALEQPQRIEYWHPGLHCCNEVWERAYLRFETPDQEIAKFTGRLTALGVAGWRRDARILDIFCGRGNGLKALERFGFTDLSGVDLSPDLLQQYQGPARLYVADARDMRFPDASFDVVVVQGGLHHLPELPGDLDRVCAEVARILKPDGRFIVVEPWRTTFLRAVDALSEVPLLRAAWAKLDAHYVMVKEEGEVYQTWLNNPDAVLGVLRKWFRPEIDRAAWAKLHFVGSPRS
jgi:SAM-dependent methyltransferase